MVKNLESNGREEFDFITPTQFPVEPICFILAAHFDCYGNPINRYWPDSFYRIKRDKNGLKSNYTQSCNMTKSIRYVWTSILPPVPAFFPHRLWLLYRIARTVSSMRTGSGSWISIKMPSYQYRKYHCGDRTVVISSYFRMARPSEPWGFSWVWQSFASVYQFTESNDRCITKKLTLWQSEYDSKTIVFLILGHKPLPKPSVTKIYDIHFACAQYYANTQNVA